MDKIFEIRFNTLPKFRFHIYVPLSWHKHPIIPSNHFIYRSFIYNPTYFAKMLTIKDELMDVCMHECAHTHAHTKNNKNNKVRTKIIKKEKSYERK